MSGISHGQNKKDRNNSLTATWRVHSVGFLFNVVTLEGFAISLLSTWHATTHHEIRIFFLSTADLGLALSASRTC
jgi:hypothetical protein